MEHLCAAYTSETADDHVRTVQYLALLQGIAVTGDRVRHALPGELQECVTGLSESAISDAGPPDFEVCLSLLWFHSVDSQCTGNIPRQDTLFRDRGRHVRLRQCMRSHGLPL